MHQLLFRHYAIAGNERAERFDTICFLVFYRLTTPYRLAISPMPLDTALYGEYSHLEKKANHIFQCMIHLVIFSTELQPLSPPKIFLMEMVS